jgi:peptidoglycan/LPS O-acetylase OafA/YrhL
MGFSNAAQPTDFRVQFNKQRLIFLDGLRGLAAFYVMVEHARWLLWEGFTEGYLKHPEAYPLPAKLLVYFMLIFSFGHQAVLLFFVLSGFVIHLRYAQQIEQQGSAARFDWRAYMLRRIKRLYPPFLFALLLTFLLDHYGAGLGYSIYTQNTAYPLINLNINSHFEPLTLLGSLLFVMTVYVPVWGSNGPVWSLVFEWWFYMVYPLFWAMSRRSIRLATLILVALFLLSFLPWSGVFLLAKTLFSLMLSWWFGALLADIYVGRITFKFWKIGLLSLLLPILLPLVIPISTLSAPFLTLEDIAWGVGFAGLIAACLSWQNRGGSLRILETFKPLGDCSYTLYVIHFPILTLLSGYVMSRASDGLLPRDFGWTFVGVALCLAIAFGLHFFTERPFIARRS